MDLLAIDTVLENCSVGVDAGTDAPVLVSETIGRGHAERLFGMIEAAMAEARLGFGDLDRIAVTVGPGSFTGLRVGIAAARGLALVTRCSTVGIGTLAVLADTARESVGRKAILAVLDARRGEVYAQLFADDGTACGVPEAGPPEYFAARIDTGTWLAGSGSDLVAAHHDSAAGRIAHRQAAPDIGALVRLARVTPAQDTPPRPLYIRPADAKPQPTAAVTRK